MSNLTMTRNAITEIKRNFELAGVSEFNIKLTVTAVDGELTFEMSSVEADEAVDTDTKLEFDGINVYIPSDQVGAFAGIVIDFKFGDQPQFIFSKTAEIENGSEESSN